MNVAKQTNSPSIRNKKQKCRLVPLVGLLLNNGKEFTGSYIKKLVELLTIEKNEYAINNLQRNLSGS